MMATPLYFDYTANTPADMRVVQKFCEIEGVVVGNANSHHGAGLAAKNLLDEATQEIAQIVKWNADEIIYTSGASESNNTAIRGIAHAKRHVGKHIITTPLEHTSVSAPLTALQEAGYEIEMVRIGTDGKVDLNDLRSLLRRDTILMTVTAVDSELGTVQPVNEIAKIVKTFGNCCLHVDATQAVGKLPFDFNVADTLSFAPHKFYGLNGSGILLKKKALVIEPLIAGGASTTMFRSGTPAVSLGVSAATALKLATDEFDARLSQVQKMNEEFRKRLSAYDFVRINSPADAVPHILNISVKGVKGADFQKALDDRGVCVSVKSACSTDSLPSRAVFAVSRDRKNALSSWRISLSHLTTDAEVEAFFKAFEDACREFSLL